MGEWDNPPIEPSAEERSIYSALQAVRSMRDHRLISEAEHDAKVDELLDDLITTKKIGRVALYDQDAMS